MKDNFNAQQYILNILEHEKKCHESRLLAVTFYDNERKKESARYKSLVRCYEEQAQHEQEFIDELEACIEWVISAKQT